jgi:hypothetical protein
MPRKSRIDAAGALHHIIVRGIERGKIFKGVCEILRLKSTELWAPGASSESFLLLGLPAAGVQYGSALPEVEYFRIGGEFVG